MKLASFPALALRRSGRRRRRERDKHRSSPNQTNNSPFHFFSFANKFDPFSDCGWGDCSNPILYEMMLMKGWAPEKIVVGLVTNPANGSGFIPFDILASVLPLMVGQHARFGGVMGWEYFNSLPGGRERPWEWARWMTRILKAEQAMAPDVVMPVGRVEMPPAEKEKAEGKVVEADADEDGKEQEAPLPQEFEYHSDGIAEE